MIGLSASERRVRITELFAKESVLPHQHRRVQKSNCGLRSTAGKIETTAAVRAADSAARRLARQHLGHPLPHPVQHVILVLTPEAQHC
eukprot:3134280-Pyramimonas_sp.AAC.1